MAAANGSRVSALNWPSAAHFAMVMQNPKVAFRDPELQHIRITADRNHQPRVWAGAFANVYEGTFADGRKRAVRVFISASPERQERYQAIAQHLQHHNLRSLVDFRYEDRGVRSGGDGKWYPLVTMDWVAGETLYDWVRAQCLSGNGKALSRACDLWIHTVKELYAANVAHGDLQHGNVMIAVSGELKLVDYDCMCVPTLVGRKNLEIGVDPYQHPQRNEDTRLSLEIDNFSALFILVALKALAAAPDLWQRFVEQIQYDKLLIRHEDLAAPNHSELIRVLRRSPDQEVQRLSKELVDLAQVRMDQVPRLDQVLFSFASVELKLNQRDFDGAIELLSRGSKRIADAPAALQPRLQDAQQRVQCRLDLEQAVHAGDEAAMQRLYVPKLCDDYPKAQPLVAIAKDASRVLPLLQRLQGASQAQSWREFVQVWDANQSLLSGRKSAERLAPLAAQWRERNRLCDELRTLLSQPDDDPALLVAAAQRLEQIGWPPEADSWRRQIDGLLRRGQAWEALRQVPQANSEESDAQFVRAWNEPLFAAWPPAERQRPRLVEARQRLALLEQLQQQSAQPLTLEGEKSLLKLARTMPGGYAYALRVRVQQAGQRLQALKRLQDALKEPASERVIVEACRSLEQSQARHLVPAGWGPRILLAQQRIAALLALKEIPPDYPPAQAPHYDPKLLDAWRDELLRGCHDAQPWAAAYRAAVQRRRVHKQFEAALASGDKLKIVDLIAHPCLKGVPIPDHWMQTAHDARAEVEAARKLVEVLANNQRPRFQEVFDARIIRHNASAFAPHESKLREWLSSEILPAAKLGIGTPVGSKALEPRSGSDEVFLVSWNWPLPRFSEECVLVICRDRPPPQSDPRALNVYFRQWIDRQRFEEGSGAVIVHVDKLWVRGYVVVWAAVNLGFDTFFSEAVLLGRLKAPLAGPQRGEKQ